MADVEEGFNKLKAENNARLKPLQEMVKQGEILTGLDYLYPDNQYIPAGINPVTSRGQHQR